MRFLPSHELNKNKWDALIRSGDYYSFSFYLDAVAKNWGVYTDENYTKGFAVCYNQALGIRIIYPPFLGRYIEFIGLSEDEKEQAVHKLQGDFEVAELRLQAPAKSLRSTEILFQCMDENSSYNTLCRRMLSKARKLNYQVSPASPEQILPIVYRELSPKVKDFGTENYARLTDFVNRLNQRGSLLSLGIFDEQQQLAGGLLFYATENRIYYITGACETEARDNGGMYLCMDHAIQQALAEKKSFDFGGSNIPSVRRFFLAMGGKDHSYYACSWNHAPWWFALLRKIRKRF
ncbi:MAG: hypothetical protein K0R65_2208 [Crocinitomicaceae bacterium]|jgi:hypothetical protein|nr:hypothetical protein [Crocinitomicaceae bacterium]